jgi:predicted dehydrogenase/nucleoside-diphosphate-sugar epimerase
MVEPLRRINWLPTVLVDNSPQRLDTVAYKLGLKGRSVLKTPSWQSVADKFDAAIVAVPNALHCSIGTALAEAGKHVFMEKPLAITSKECSEIISAAEKSGVTLSVGHTRRHLHVARWTKALLDAKVLGKIKHFEVHEGNIFNWEMTSNALLQANMAGGGVLMDTGPHTIDLLLWWLGDVELRSYRDDSMGGVEADCELDCRLSSGADGRVELSRTRALSNSMRIEGTEGFIEVHISQNAVLAGSANALAFTHNGISANKFPSQPNLFEAELSDFRTSASGGGWIGVSGQEGAKSVELIERCYRHRQPLSLPWTEVPIDISTEAQAPITALPQGTKILVTGATGFIGGRLVERLVRETGAQVRCLVRNLASATRLARLPVEIVRADLNNANDVDRAVQHIEYVFHCAYDRLSREQNINGLHNLITACAKHSVRRLVHVSSFGVYEPFPDGPLTEETRDGDRSSVYVNTKLDLEKILFDIAGHQNVPATIVQPTIVYGPFCGTWTNAIAEMLIYGNVVLPGRGEGLCNAVYVDDIVDGLAIAALSPAAVGKRFIMSGPRPITWGTFFTAFAKALGTNPPSYWPRERIINESQGIFRELRLGLSDPRRIVKLLMRWNFARQALNAGLSVMPAPWQSFFKNYYKDGRLGETFLPNSQLLALYSSQALATAEKARSLLGYQPRFDFQRGMTLTSDYLDWAFDDTRRLVAAKRKMAARKDISPNADIVTAGQ